jgi:hypothetical protein
MAIDKVRNDLLIDVLVELLIANAHLTKGSGENITKEDIE